MGITNFPYVRIKSDRIKRIPGTPLRELGSDISVSTLLEIERMAIARTFPRLQGATLYWRGGSYFSQVRRLCSEPELVLLNKPLSPLEKKEARDLKRLDPNRLELFANDSLDLGEVRQARLIRRRSSLFGLTEEQESYFHSISSIYSILKDLYLTKGWLEPIQ